MDIWAEKYRPKKFEDLILPSTVENLYKKILETKEIPNLLLYSSPGTGKTSSVKVLAKELDYEVLYINASLENTIDVIRTKVQTFAASKSFFGKRKLCFLDEADRISIDGLNSLKVLIEQFSSNCSFVIATNYIAKFPEPIISRFQVVNFEEYDEEEERELQKKYAGRLLKILKNEGVKNVDKELKRALIRLVQKTFPDLRKAIVELQRLYYSYGENITVEAVDKHVKDFIEETIKKIYQGKYREVVKEILSKLTPEQFYVEVYRKMKKAVNVSDEDLMGVMMILAKYAHQHYITVDRELNLAACIAELITFLMKEKK